MYKLVVSDLDGTLVNSEKCVSDYTKKIVSLLREKGIEFIIATGRNYKGARHIYETLNLNSVMICNNGSTIYDQNGNLIFQRTLDSNISVEVLEIILKENCVFLACYGTETYIGEGTLDKVNSFLYSPIESPTEISKDNLHSYTFEKIVIMDKDNDKLRKLSKIFNAYNEINAFISQDDYLDIVHFETSKGQALKAIANLKNIDLKNTIAFGDAFNDYEMLKFAGKGIVMANGFNDLKTEFETMDFTNNEHGVARYLSKLFNLEK
ncbi:Cof-type HAD-IIB family hydrolase (plasmid) [Cetobacterium somerae]|jgi:Cof subfamily protein (haloacid dehalogenase superfamily)|uniref:Cof-type HAD-IIB family hydrolase n=1 Tax=Cetobacterium somerae TaxID=188913 RepID=UPI003D766B02